MNGKRLAWLSALLVLLLAAGALLRGREKQAQLTRGVATQLAPSDLSLDRITAFQLSVGNPDKPQLELAKQEGRWHVPAAYGAPADTDRLSRLVNKLRGVSGEERARGENWFDDFGVGDAGARLTLRENGRTVLSLVLGRGKKNPNTNFARLPEGQTIYALDEEILGEAGLWGSAPSPASLSPQDWVDLRVFQFDSARLAHAELAQKEAEGWVARAERHQPFGASDWTAWNGFLALRAKSVADPAVPFQPSWRWIFTFTDGTRGEWEESAPAAGADSVILRPGPDGPYWNVPAAPLDQFRKTLLPPEPAKEKKPKKKR